MEGFSIDVFSFDTNDLCSFYRCVIVASPDSVLYTFWLLVNHIYSFSSLIWFILTASFEMVQDSAFTAFFIFGFTFFQIGHIETFRPHRKCDFPNHCWLFFRLWNLHFVFEVFDLTPCSTAIANCDAIWGLSFGFILCGLTVPPCFS